MGFWSFRYFLPGDPWAGGRSSIIAYDCPTMSVNVNDTWLFILIQNVPYILEHRGIQQHKTVHITQARQDGGHYEHRAWSQHQVPDHFLLASLPLLTYCSAVVGFRNSLPGTTYQVSRKNSCYRTATTLPVLVLNITVRVLLL